MKTLKPKKGTKGWSEAVDKARLRLTQAKKRARLARQRRKVAKLAARHAKQRLKKAKERVAEAKLALAEIETKLAKLHETPAKSRAKRIAAKKVAVVSRQKKLSPAAVIQPGEVTKINKPVVRRAKRRVKAVARRKVASPTIPVSLESEPPVPVIAAADAKTTAEIVKGVEDIFTAETAADPAVPENISAAAASEPADPDQLNH